MDFHKGIKVLKRWRWTFIGVSVLSFCLVAFAPESKTEAAPVFYKSSAKILLTPSSTSGIGYSGAGTTNYGDLARTWFADPTILNELIRSEELLTRVQTNSGLDVSWEVLRSMIAIEPVTDGPDRRMSFGSLKLFKLSVTSDDPTKSERLTRLVTEEFVNYVEDLSAREFANTRRFIEEMVDEADQRRLAAEEELLQIREKYAGSPSEESIQSEERALEAERQSVNREITTLKGRVGSIRDYMDGRVSSPPWTILENREGSLAGLESNISKHKLELAQAREVYTDTNDKVVILRKRLKRAEELYQEALSDYVGSLYQSNSSELAQKISQSHAITKQLNALVNSKMTADDRRLSKKLERQMTLWDENHLSLTQKLYQARVVEQSSRRQGSVNILEQPRRGSALASSVGPVGASKMKKMAMGFPICLLLGFAAVFLREFLSTSMKLRPRIEEALEIPVIAVIPATPSELTVDWERFKRPNAERLNALVMAHSNETQHANGHGANGNGRSNGNGVNGNGRSNGNGVNGNGRSNGRGSH